jgi:hypothetical protein
MGPLPDVLAVRAAYGHDMRYYIAQVIVRGDWAQVEITGKGFRFAELHRTGGKWSTREVEAVPPDSAAFFKRVYGESVDAENANFKPAAAETARVPASIDSTDVSADAVAAPSRDAYGSRNDVAHVCRVLDDMTADVEPASPHAIRHIVVARDYAIATVRVAFDSFNVLVQRQGTTWSAPYAVGPEFPDPELFATLGVPAATGRSLFDHLQALNQIAPPLRKDPCT